MADDGNDGGGHSNLSCSFCGKNQRDVQKLIAGPTVYICDECIGLCGDIIDDELERAPLQDIREIDGAVETLYVMPLRRGLHGFRDVVLLSDDLFPNTHPDTEKRIDRIYDAADATDAA